MHRLTTARVLCSLPRLERRPLVARDADRCRESLSAFPKDLTLTCRLCPQIYRNALPPNPPNLTMTINDMYGFGDGNLAAGRMRVALYGTIERVEGDQEIEKCKHAYLQGN